MCCRASLAAALARQACVTRPRRAQGTVRTRGSRIRGQRSRGGARARRSRQRNHLLGQQRSLQRSDALGARLRESVAAQQVLGSTTGARGVAEQQGEGLRTAAAAPAAPQPGAHGPALCVLPGAQHQQHGPARVLHRLRRGQQVRGAPRQCADAAGGWRRAAPRPAAERLVSGVPLGPLHASNARPGTSSTR